MREAVKILVLVDALSLRHFGGGFGLGTPVVSYPPRPMSQGAEGDVEEEAVIVSVLGSC